MKLAIADIVVRDRYRKDMGNLRELADSIKAEGMLQPIGITEDKRLVFGERRLTACRDILGWTEIEARVVKVSSIIAGEYAENEMRKDFTPSERTAIAEAVRAEEARQQGGDRRSDDFQAGQSSHLKPRPQRTRDVVAKQVGFSSGKQLERAENVVRLGAPQVVAKMDSGQLSISKAANIVQLPVVEQIAAVAEDDDDDAKADALKALRHEIEMQVIRSGADAYTNYVQKHEARPDKDTAATIGKLLGRQVRASDGTMQPPKSPSQKTAEKRARDLSKRDKHYYDQVYRLRQALIQVSYNEDDPEVLVPTVRTIESEEIDKFLDKSVAWINRFAEEWRRHGR